MGKTKREKENKNTTEIYLKKKYWNPKDYKKLILKQQPILFYINCFIIITDDTKR